MNFYLNIMCKWVYSSVGYTSVMYGYFIIICAYPFSYLFSKSIPLSPIACPRKLLFLIILPSYTHGALWKKSWANTLFFVFFFISILTIFTEVACIPQLKGCLILGFSVCVSLHLEFSNYFILHSSLRNFENILLLTTGISLLLVTLFSLTHVFVIDLFLLEIIK